MPDRDNALQALNLIRGTAAMPHRGTVGVPATLVGAQATADITLALRGAQPGDAVHLEPRGLEAGLSLSHVEVTGVGTATARLANPTVANITTAAATWGYSVTRPTGN